jgi:hypothetical protein
MADDNVHPLPDEGDPIAFEKLSKKLRRNFRTIITQADHAALALESDAAAMSPSALQREIVDEAKELRETGQQYRALLARLLRMRMRFLDGEE